MASLQHSGYISSAQIATCGSWLSLDSEDSKHFSESESLKTELESSLKTLTFLLDGTSLDILELVSYLKKIH